MIEAALAAGHEPLPEWSPPDLDAPSRQAIAAWETLIGDRAEPMGPISFLAIDRWAERHGVEADAFEFLIRAVRAADEAFAAFEEERASRSQGKPA